MSDFDDPRANLLRALVRGLARTSTRVAGFNQALASRLGIGATDLECLLLLEETGPASAGQLAEVLNLTTGAITGVVDRLETAGFVARESDPSDRRRVIVRPRAERAADLQGAYAPVLAAAAQVLASRTEDELRLLLGFQNQASTLMEQQAARLKAEESAMRGNAGLSAPLGDVTAGYVEFPNGAAELRFSVSGNPAELYSAYFEGAQPSVRVQGGNVSFRYRRMGVLDWARHVGTVLLNSSIPWRIAVRDGASRVAFDASRVNVQQLSIEGGANKVDIALGEPHGTVPVCIQGGLANVRIQRPADVPAQLVIHGGANRLEFDGQRFGAVGGDLRLAGPGWELASDRYAIEVQGGASRLAIHEVQED